MPFEPGKPSRIYTKEEMKTMKMHATGDASKGPQDHYKEGSYNDLLPDIISTMPKTDENRVLLIGPSYLSTNEIIYLDILRDIPKARQMIAAPKLTYWQSFKAWFRKKFFVR